MNEGWEKAATNFGLQPSDKIQIYVPLPKYFQTFSWQYFEIHRHTNKTEDVPFLEGECAAWMLDTTWSRGPLQKKQTSHHPRDPSTSSRAKSFSAALCHTNQLYF